MHTVFYVLKLIFDVTSIRSVMWFQKTCQHNFQGKTVTREPRTSKDMCICVCVTNFYSFVLYHFPFLSLFWLRFCGLVQTFLKRTSACTEKKLFLLSHILRVCLPVWDSKAHQGQKGRGILKESKSGWLRKHYDYKTKWSYPQIEWKSFLKILFYDSYSFMHIYRLLSFLFNIQHSRISW